MRSRRHSSADILNADQAPNLGHVAPPLPSRRMHRFRIDGTEPRSVTSTQMCRSGALGGAHLATFCARVRCAEVERGSAVLYRCRVGGPSDSATDSDVVARSRPSVLVR